MRRYAFIMKSAFDVCGEGVLFSRELPAYVQVLISALILLLASDLHQTLIGQDYKGTKPPVGLWDLFHDLSWS